MGQLGDDLRAWSEAPGVRIIDGRRMACKNISDQAFLVCVRKEAGRNGFTTAVRIHAELENQLGPIPRRLFLAKARKLIAAGKLNGCGCGCRGDFSIPQPSAQF